MHEHMNRHVQTTVPAPVHRKLHDLAYETGRSIGDLLLDATLLLLRYHGHAEGLPEPQAPRTTTTTTSEWKCKPQTGEK
jgi:hypothetical protein